MEEEEVEDDQLRTLPRSLLDLAQASVPAHLKALRACKRCGVIKTVEQFMNDGCENCPMLDMVRIENPSDTLHKSDYYDLFYRFVSFLPSFESYQRLITMNE